MIGSSADDGTVTYPVGYVNNIGGTLGPFGCGLRVRPGRSEGFERRTGGHSSCGYGGRFNVSVKCSDRFESSPLGVGTQRVMVIQGFANLADEVLP
jgi:hypothetical protein